MWLLLAILFYMRLGLEISEWTIRYSNNKRTIDPEHANVLVMDVYLCHSHCHSAGVRMWLNIEYVFVCLNCVSYCFSCFLYASNSLGWVEIVLVVDVDVALYDLWQLNACRVFCLSVFLSAIHMCIQMYVAFNVQCTMYNVRCACAMCIEYIIPSY